MKAKQSVSETTEQEFAYGIVKEYKTVLLYDLSLLQIFLMGLFFEIPRVYFIGL